MSSVNYKKGNGKHHCSQNLPWCIVVKLGRRRLCHFPGLLTFCQCFLHLAVKKIDNYDE